MALIEHQGNEALWHDAFQQALDSYTDLWEYVDTYYKNELNVTLPLDTLRRVVDDLIWETNDTIRQRAKALSGETSDISEILKEAAVVFDGAEDEL
jgi:hypothetical protein